MDKKVQADKIKVKESQKEVVETAESKEKTKAEKILTILILFIYWCVSCFFYEDAYLLSRFIIFPFLILLLFAGISIVKENPKIRAKCWLKTFFVIWSLFLFYFMLVVTDWLLDYTFIHVLYYFFFLLVAFLLLCFSILKEKKKIKKIWIVITILLLLFAVSFASFTSIALLRKKRGFGCSGSYGGIDSNGVWTASFSKPIIYLYPEQTKDVAVTLGNPENLTHTYPKYEEEWNVVAQPNGDLTDDKGRRYYALYWEGLNSKEPTSKDGFIVKGADTISFLEEKLALLGLTEREANEFIVYWLPELESNEYNFIRFETAEEIETNMPLYIEPQPDTIIRVMMEFRSASETEQVEEQKLPLQPERKGFVVVEWGGTRLKQGE